MPRQFGWPRWQRSGIARRHEPASLKFYGRAWFDRISGWRIVIGVLTLLTRPALVRPGQLLSKSNPFLQDGRQIFRRIKGFLKGRGLEASYPGHSAVTGSLLRGLDKLSFEYKLNPYRLSGDGPVGILAGSKTLSWAIESNTVMASRDFIVGPNVHVLGSENSDGFSSDFVRRILVPSDWVLKRWSIDTPGIADKLCVWPCGVDFEYWDPGLEVEQPQLPLIYLKIKWPDLRVRIINALRLAGLDFREITYGSYSQNEYKTLLQKSSCVIYIGGSESQGIALLEAWAMNVPTFVYDAPSQVINLSDGRSLKLHRGEFSPAPFLTEARGALWNDSSNLLDLIGKAQLFNPRASSIAEFTDEIRAGHYLEIANLGNIG